MENLKSGGKVFLGGWRNKLTGIIYCNACTQTVQNGGRNEKRVQTEFAVDKFTNVERDVAVQADSFPDVRDRIVGKSSSKDFGSLQGHSEEILRSVVKIQRFYRRHRGHRSRQTTSCSPAVSPENTRREQIRPEAGGVSCRSRDFVILNRTSPTTREDFELLYNLLDRWRVCETRRANEQLFPASRIALCNLILSKEVELLRAIDAIKSAAKLKRRERSYGRFLDDLSKPVRWKTKSGGSILVDTPRVLRARSFRDAFEELSRDNADTKERLEALKRLKRDVEQHTCGASNEVIRLLDQEMDLLERSADGSKLNWLRSRLRMAFLRLAREALRNEFGSSLVAPKRMCRSCGRLLPLQKFPNEKRRRSSSCSYCLYAKVRAVPRVIYEPYQRLLRDIRRQEGKLHCYTSPAFVIDAKTVYHLVNDVWHGKSAISENDSLEELRLARFKREEEWSPWNCLLLTAREASLHRKVEDLCKFYGPMMLQKFYAKNLQAKVRLRSVTEFKAVYG